jgi:hypothetical protein
MDAIGMPIASCNTVPGFGNPETQRWIETQGIRKRAGSAQQENYLQNFTYKKKKK